jgi:hypothetical protein
VTVLAGPFVIAALLLAAGGVLKAVRPGDTATALAAVGLPRSTVPVRVGGALEALVGVAALAVGGALPAILVGVSYAAFAAFVLVALRAGTPVASCGCFGKVDTPPSPLHVVVDLAAAGVAVGVALAGDVSLPAILDAQPLFGIPFVLLVLVGSALVFLTLTALPKTNAAARTAREART